MGFAERFRAESERAALDYESDLSRSLTCSGLVCGTNRLKHIVKTSQTDAWTIDSHITVLSFSQRL